MGSKGQNNNKQQLQQPQQDKMMSTTAPPPQKKDKRTISDVSNESHEFSLDTTSVLNQLKAITTEIAGLKGSLQNILKKDDIEELITGTITKTIEALERKMKDEIDRRENEQTREL